MVAAKGLPPPRLLSNAALYSPRHRLAGRVFVKESNHISYTHLYDKIPFFTTPQHSIRHLYLHTSDAVQSNRKVNKNAKWKIIHWL